ncbi:MAG: C40 family peptidase [Kiloniellales bacterium]
MAGRLDPRFHAYRDDLAAEDLRGRVPARRFVAGTCRRVRVGAAPLRRAPRPDALLDTELLFGEGFTVFEDRDGWAWGQSRIDGYVGYVPSAALAEDLVEPTHRVAALRTFLTPAPELKCPPDDGLAMNGLVAVAEVGDRYCRLATGGWVFAAHLAPLGEPEPDFVAVARRFLGVPYLWGGRTSLGLDCSGLVQLALQAAGIACPRDSDIQAAVVGRAIASPDPGRLERGDLVFLPDHAGFVEDGGLLLHANARDMAVSLHPLAEVLAREQRLHGHGIMAVRRLAALSAAPAAAGQMQRPY